MAKSSDGSPYISHFQAIGGIRVAGSGNCPIGISGRTIWRSAGRAKSSSKTGNGEIDITEKVRNNSL